MGDRMAKLSPFDEVVLSAECGSFNTHDAHILHRGFLGLGRVTCPGYVHKHLMRLRPIRHTFAGRDMGRPFFLFIVNWECYCGYAVTANKTGFYKALLGKPNTTTYMEM